MALAISAGEVVDKADVKKQEEVFEKREDIFERRRGGLTEGSSTTLAQTFAEEETDGDGGSSFGGASASSR